jgi:hypothetical protein
MEKNKVGGGAIASIIVAGLLLIAVISGGIIYGQRNTAVKIEKRYEAQLAANKSNHSAMWTKVKQLTQVTDKQAEHFKDVYTSLIEGRNKDENLLFKAIKEENPSLSADVYNKLSDEIVSGRNSFDNNQKALADIAREYNSYIDTHLIMKTLTGRQELDPTKDIIISDATAGSYESGIETDISID